VSDRPVSVPMTPSDNKRRDAMGQLFTADLRNYASIVRPKTTKLGTVPHVGKSIFLGGQPLPRSPSQAEPQRPKIFLGIYAHTV